MRRALFIGLAIGCLDCFGWTEAAEEEFDRWYVGGAAQMVLPQGGSDLRRLGGGTARIGCHITPNVAVEGEAAWLEDRCGLGLRSLVHFAAWDEYDQLFGYSRFDPFLTIGVQGWLKDGQLGPVFGLGALYYLTDRWAIRGDAAATLGLDTRVEMVYAISLGIQYSF